MHRSEQAKAFIEALALNSVDFEDIIKWADSIILKDVSPEITVIELALANNISDMVIALNKIAENADELISMQILFGLLYKALSSGVADYSAVTKRLYQWHSYEAETSKYSDLSYFWDALYLKDRGTVENEILEYLKINSA